MACYRAMRIAKPILLVTTPIGMAEGLYEGYRLAGGLVFIMIAMVVVMLAALGSVIVVIRREAARDAAARTNAHAAVEPPREG